MYFLRDGIHFSTVDLCDDGSYTKKLNQPKKMVRHRKTLTATLPTLNETNDPTLDEGKESSQEDISEDDEEDESDDDKSGDKESEEKASPEPKTDLRFPTNVASGIMKFTMSLNLANGLERVLDLIQAVKAEKGSLWLLRAAGAKQVRHVDCQ
jgi:hypothetical protein